MLSLLAAIKLIEDSLSKRKDSHAAELHCAITGIFAPLAGLVCTLQAAEALKLLMGIERGLSGKLLTINALDMNIMRSTLSKYPACRACMAL